MQKSEITLSPFVVQNYLLGIPSVRKHTRLPLGEIPFLSSIKGGENNKMDAKEVKMVGFGPEQIQSLLKLAECSSRDEMSVLIAFYLVALSTP